MLVIVSGARAGQVSWWGRSVSCQLLTDWSLQWEKCLFWLRAARPRVQQVTAATQRSSAFLNICFNAAPFMSLFVIYFLIPGPLVPPRCLTLVPLLPRCIEYNCNVCSQLICRDHRCLGSLLLLHIMIYGCKSDRPVSRICSPALFSYRCLHSEPRWHQTTCAVYCCYDLEPHQTEIVSRSGGGSRRRGWQQLAVVSTCHSSLPLQLGAHKSLGNGSEIAGWRIPIEQNPNSVRCTFNGDYDLKWILANRTQQKIF